MMDPHLDSIRFESALRFALDVMGERWSFLILRAAIHGVAHFEEFQALLGIARTILSSRLANLVQHDILVRARMAEDRRKVTYHLTDKGRALGPTIIALRQWGEEWGSGENVSRILADERDQLPIRRIMIQAADGRELHIDELCILDTRNATGRCMAAFPANPPLSNRAAVTG